MVLLLKKSPHKCLTSCQFDSYTLLQTLFFYRHDAKNHMKLNRKTTSFQFSINNTFIITNLKKVNKV